MCAQDDHLILPPPTRQLGNKIRDLMATRHIRLPGDLIPGSGQLTPHVPGRRRKRPRIPQMPRPNQPRQTIHMTYEIRHQNGIDVFSHVRLPGRATVDRLNASLILELSGWGRSEADARQHNRNPTGQRPKRLLASSARPCERLLCPDPPRAGIRA